MNFTYCTVEDLNRIEVGQELKINGGYEDLKREDGTSCDFVIRKDDFVIVQSKNDSYLVVRLLEDVIKIKTGRKERYGEFVVKPNHIQQF